MSVPVASAGTRTPPIAATERRRQAERDRRANEDDSYWGTEPIEEHARTASEGTED